MNQYRSAHGHDRTPHHSKTSPRKMDPPSDSSASTLAMARRIGACMGEAPEDFDGDGRKPHGI